MRVVHKYTVHPSELSVDTYEGARFLHVANQREQITVWAEVNPQAPRCARFLHVVGTGFDAPEDADYIGTALMASGTFVFHIYADREVTP